MKYSDNQVAEAVKVCNSWSDVYRYFKGADAKPSPGMQSHFKRRALKVGIDFSHFRFQRSEKPVAVEPEVKVEVAPVAEPTSV